MRWIAAARDARVATGEDKEYTDWTALATLVDDWVARLKRG